MHTSVSLARVQAFRSDGVLAFCFNGYVTPKDRLIAQLKALCKKHGLETVAEQARISAENLRQIVAGRKLESGAPRGVGPTLQRKLEAKYPGWSDEPVKPPNGYKDRHEVSNSDFATLQAVKTILSEAEIADIKARADEIERRVTERIEQMKKRL